MCTKLKVDSVEFFHTFATFVSLRILRFEKFVVGSVLFGRRKQLLRRRCLICKMNDSQRMISNARNYNAFGIANVRKNFQRVYI